MISRYLTSTPNNQPDNFRISLIKIFWLLIKGVVVGFAGSFLVFQYFPYFADIQPHDDHETAGAIIENPGTHESNEFFHEIKNKSLFEQLAEDIRVFCMVLTHPKNHETKARHVKATWGKRCDFLFFMSTEEGTYLLF